MIYELLSGVTSTGNGVRGPVASIEATEAAYRKVSGYLNGVGTVSASVLIEGSTDRINWVNLGTLVLSGTASAEDFFPTGLNAWDHISATPSAITGSGASLKVFLEVIL